MTSTYLPLPSPEDLDPRRIARPLTRAELTAYSGRDREDVVAGCWLSDGRLFLDAGDCTVTLPADPLAVTRRVIELVARIVDDEALALAGKAA